MISKPFLRAVWQDLLLVNYEVERTVLERFVPRGTELDDWRGNYLVSVVGFLFLDTRVLGLRVPFHTDFEEINLRFYVRREAGGELRRGVVFIKEVVPRAALALVARCLFNENYVALPTEHKAPEADGLIRYRWKLQGVWNEISGRIHGKPAPLVPGSEAEFLTEHYWGYNGGANRRTCEYRVEHPPWRTYQTSEAALTCDVERMYGAAFAPYLAAQPVSAYVAEGSPVTVFFGRDL